MHLVPCPAWLIRKDQSKPCISFDGKVDGFGAELVQMVSAMSYTAACGALFCGVGWWAMELTHGVHVPTAIQRLFGECALPVLRPLSGQPPCNSTSWPGRPNRCHFSGLPQLLFHLTYMTPAFLTDLRSILLPQLLPLAKAHAGRFTVAMHIRRGDITLGRHSKRYTPDTVYFGVAAAIFKIREDAEIHVFSDSAEPHMFTRYLDLGIQVHLGGDALEAMAHFSTANIFVMAKSSFSFVPALLNPRCVLYQPNTGVGGIWVEGLNHWVHLSTNNSLAARIKACAFPN